MSRMKAVQVSKPGGNFELVERNIPEPGRRPGPHQSRSLRHLSQRRAGERRPLARPPISARSRTRNRRTHRRRRRRRHATGNLASASASAGTAVTAFACDPCRRGDFVNCARSKRSPPSATTAATRNTWSRPPKRSLPFPTIFPPPKPRLCCAPASRSSTRCATRARAPEIWSRCKASEDSAISESSTRARWASAPFAIGRGKDKEALARKLGAHSLHRYRRRRSCRGTAEIRRRARNPRHRARLESPCRPWSTASLRNGKLIVVGAGADPLTVTPASTDPGQQGSPGMGLRNRHRFRRHPAVQRAQSGVRPMIEKYPLEKAAEAYEQMISGRARFRVVLTMGQ